MDYSAIVVFFALVLSTSGKFVCISAYSLKYYVCLVYDHAQFAV